MYLFWCNWCYHNLNSLRHAGHMEEKLEVYLTKDVSLEVLMKEIPLGAKEKKYERPRKRTGNLQNEDKKTIN